MGRYIGVFLMAFFLLSNGYAMNINTATVEELVTIKGIGEKTAKKIIAERERAGFFRSLEDFSVRVRGMGKKRMEKLKKQGLSVGDSGSRIAMPEGKVKGRLGARRSAAPNPYESSPQLFLVRPRKAPTID